MRTLKGYGLLLALLGSSLGAGGLQAQSYPAKPVRMLTGSIGSGSDLVARLVATELSALLGQQVIVDSRPSGPALTVAAAKSAPDGYTLMVNATNLWISPLFGEVPYDTFRDFTPIITLARVPSLLVVHPSLPVKSVPELIKLARSQPGQLNMATGPNGGSQHIAGELLRSLAKVDIVRILYNNQSPATADTLSGQVQLTFGPTGTWAGHIKAGKVRALATTSLKRTIQNPELPTIAETLPGYVAEGLNGLFAPARTPDTVIRRVNQETARVLDRPDIRERLLNIGQESVGGSAELLADTIKSDVARVSKLIKDAGIKPEK